MPRWLRILLVVNAAVALANAAVALLAPAASMSMYGVATGSAVDLMARYAGVGSVAIGLLAWFASRMEEVGALRRILLALVASDLCGALVTVHGTVTGELNVGGWGLALVYMVFAIGYGWFLLRYQDRRQEL